MTMSEVGLDKAIAARDFSEFIKYVKVLEPPVDEDGGGEGEGGGIIEFEVWDHIREMMDLLGHHRLISVIKARQIGLSWLLAAYALWKTMYRLGSVTFMFSKGEYEAKVFLGKTKFIYDQLPHWIKNPLGNWGTATNNSGQMAWGGMLSKIVAFPSTEDAGRSDTASTVIQDEADFHKHMNANYMAVKPTIDAGGQLVQVSTVKKSDPNSLFKEIYRESLKGQNNFKRVFFGWRSRPGRDEEWYKQTLADAPTTDEMSPELYMEQEFPNSEEEALAPSKVLAAFDHEAIKGMLEETRDPIEVRGTVNIWQRFVVGHKYVAASDPSHGTGLDYAVTVILDLNTGAGVASVRDRFSSPEQLAYDSVKLLEEYDNPIWAIEANDWGILVIRKAQEMEYPSLYERSTDNAGWLTTEGNRYQVWGELMDAVRTRVITVFDRLGLNQFTTVIRNPEKNGRIEGARGTNDDVPMGYALAWQMRKFAYASGDSIVQKIQRTSD